MYLDDKQLKRANGFYNVIKNFMNMKPEEFVKSKIQICDKCHGTGLSRVFESGVGDCGWEPGNYCDKCYGIGYTGFNKKFHALSDELFICSKCQGVGCSICGNTGIVDWVTNIMGR